jgi:predicted DNA-binding transcriptional regulator AlpA
MQDVPAGGRKIRQSPQPASPKGDNGPLPATVSAARPVLLTAKQAAECWGVSERTFHALRASGLTPTPIALGPRLLRWARAEIEAGVASLPRQAEAAPMPSQLLRGKIDKIKRGAPAAKP